MAIAKQKSTHKGPPGTHQPYVADNEKMPELTWSAVLQAKSAPCAATN